MPIKTDPFSKKQSKEYFLKQLAHEKKALSAREIGDGGTAPFPHTIALAVNNRCFLRCLHCDVGEARRDKEKRFFYQRCTGDTDRVEEIPLEVLKKLIDDVYHYKPVIRPTFLEPLMRKDLFEFARYTKSKGLVFNLQTNGVLLPKRYNEILDSEIDLVRVSLDGPPTIHDHIRGVKGTFDNVISGMASIIEEKRKRGLKKPILGVSYVISGLNYTEIVNFMDYLKKIDVLEHVYVAFGFLRFITQSDADSFNKLVSKQNHMTESSVEDTGREEVDPERLISELESLLAKYPQDKVHYYFNPSQFTKYDLRKWFTTDDFLYPEVTCHVPWTHCQILYNGDVVVNGRCCSPSFGNINEKSFMEVWNSDIAKNFRMLLKENNNFSVCNRCCRKFNVQMLSE